jgi:hypothetical protein
MTGVKVPVRYSRYFAIVSLRELTRTNAAGEVIEGPPYRIRICASPDYCISVNEDSLGFGLGADYFTAFLDPEEEPTTDPQS